MAKSQYVTSCLCMCACVSVCVHMCNMCAYVCVTICVCMCLSVCACLCLFVCWTQLGTSVSPRSTSRAVSKKPLTCVLRLSLSLVASCILQIGWLTSMLGASCLHLSLQHGGSQAHSTTHSFYVLCGDGTCGPCAHIASILQMGPSARPRGRSHGGGWGDY